MDVIASWRAQGYFSHFKAAGFLPVLVTMRWEVDQAGGWKWHGPSARPCIEHLPGGECIIRLPRHRSFASRLYNLLANVRVLRRLFIVWAWICAELDATPEQWDCYRSYRKFLYKHLKTAHYAAVVAIFSPHHHLRLAFNLNRRFGIPYVLDFRDLWNTRLVMKDYKPTRREGLQDACFRWHWRRWLGNAAFFSITSEKWRDWVAGFTPTTGYVLRNGYEAAHFSSSSKTTQPNQAHQERFIMLHCGSLYRHQVLAPFVEGLRRFLEKEQPKSFELRLIGADKGQQPRESTSYMSAADLRALFKPLSEVLHLKKRCSKAESAKHMQAAEVLLMPSFPAYKGVYSAKIFDYLAARRPILLTPDDNGLLSALLVQRNAGTIASTAEEVHDFCKTAYQSWKKHGRYPFLGQEEGLDAFSRQHQVKCMGNYINQALKR